MKSYSKAILVSAVWAFVYGAVAGATPIVTTVVDFRSSAGTPTGIGPLSFYDDNFYTTTRSGGGGGSGTVLTVPSGSGTVIQFSSFGGTSGASPFTTFVSDHAGTLYGVAQQGGNSTNSGTVFQLSLSTHIIKSVGTFSGSNGGLPNPELILDNAGNLFGTTRNGGGPGGTIFEIAAGSNQITTLANFTVATGYRPMAGLVVDTHGNFFGTASLGGSNNDGTIFELPAYSNTIITLANFTGGNGMIPSAPLTLDAFGNLFGTTQSGGRNGAGTIFELPAGSSTIANLAGFSSATGSTPLAPLIMDSSGNMFGTASKGGAGNVGTVFELLAGSTTIATLASFDTTNGATPQTSLISDASGDLFGTTTTGGIYNGGTIFEVTHSGFVVPEPNMLVLAFVGLTLLNRRAWR